MSGTKIRKLGKSLIFILSEKLEVLLPNLKVWICKPSDFPPEHARMSPRSQLVLVYLDLTGVSHISMSKWGYLTPAQQDLDGMTRQLDRFNGILSMILDSQPPRCVREICRLCNTNTGVRVHKIGLFHIHLFL